MSTITPKNHARAGLSRSALYRSAQRGTVERISRGVYLPAGADVADQDLLEASARRPESTLCLISALAHHDLLDTIPSAVDIAIPRGSRIPAGTRAISWHQFDRATFDLGRTTMTIPGSDDEIGIYSAERSIADAFRMRSEVGYETARDALAEWLRQGGRPADLLAVAEHLPRSRMPLIRALEVLA